MSADAKPPEDEFQLLRRFIGECYESMNGSCCTCLPDPDRDEALGAVARLEWVLTKGARSADVVSPKVEPFKYIDAQSGELKTLSTMVPGFAGDPP